MKKNVKIFFNSNLCIEGMAGQFQTLPFPDSLFGRIFFVFLKSLRIFSRWKLNFQEKIVLTKKKLSEIL